MERKFTPAHILRGLLAKPPTVPDPLTLALEALRPRYQNRTNRAAKRRYMRFEKAHERRFAQRMDVPKGKR